MASLLYLLIGHLAIKKAYYIRLLKEKKLKGESVVLKMETFRQDMPPEGGYGPIAYKRVPQKTYFGGISIILGYFAMTSVAGYLYYLNLQRLRKEKVEMRSAKLAISPIIIAERDRAFLKQLRRNRDEEAKLMANVPGWVVGTWYGEPVYKMLPADTLVSPVIEEFYVHADPKELNKRLHITFWS